MGQRDQGTSKDKDHFARNCPKGRGMKRGKCEGVGGGVQPGHDGMGEGGLFALCTRSMEGSQRRVDVGPSMTLTGVRTQHVGELPPFLEVKLLQGTKKLVDGAAVEVEVQAVATKSTAKASSCSLRRSGGHIAEYQNL